MKVPFLERIARIKLEGFERAARIVCAENGLEFPDLPSRLIRCWLPDHVDRTGSLLVDETHWHCFGCQKRGDALDLVQELEGLSLPKAVARLEGVLGITDGLEGLVDRARRADAPPSTEREAAAWRRAVEGLERVEGAPPSVAAEFLEATRWHTHSADPLVRGIASGPADWVHDELREEASRPPPRLLRARRERLRSLRAWALSVARWIAREVERSTGRDRLDLLLEAATCRGLVEDRAHAVGLLPSR